MSYTMLLQMGLLEFLCSRLLFDYGSYSCLEGYRGNLVAVTGKLTLQYSTDYFDSKSLASSPSALVRASLTA